MTDSPWILEFEGVAPEDEGRRETLSTLGNGLFATRGAAPESNADGVHCPGTYAAGVYNRLVSTVAGRQLEHESLVNLPNWLPLTFRADEGPWFGSPEIDVLTYSQRLDLSHGMLTRRIRVRDPSDRQTSVVERRIVHMAEPHLAALEWVITPENWTGSLTIRSLLDGEVENRNVVDHRSLAGRHLRAVATGEATPGTCWLEVETTQSHLRCVVAARTTVMIEDRPQPVERSLYRSGQRIGHKLVLDVNPGETVVVEKVVSLFTAHDHAISEPRIAAIEALAVADSFDRMLHSHQLEWEHLWRRCDLRLGDGESETARTLNLHVFHVLQTLSPHVADRDVGVPARGLHGEGYRGHIFWDELFVFPFLNLRIPDLTRALLLYRYRRLSAARRAAREAGHKGAMYPWQSGSDGREETPTQFYNARSDRWMPDNSRRQRHVGLAVAYNVWQYYQVTGDVDFLASHGAEMLIEISRFFAGLARLDPVDGRFHISGVMGPDEFHDGYPDRPVKVLTTTPTPTFWCRGCSEGPSTPTHCWQIATVGSFGNDSG
ncbi:MAG: glycoside hydrolase family 65 protein [Acidobacteria bacterium]|nr:glycoside hydrolase family 65 protein [Acidobacteriota bacterium]